MTWGVILDIAAPVESYDVLHHDLLDTIGPTVDGLLLHVARPTDSGFQIIEVWESRELCDRYTRELVAPAMAKRFGDGPPPDMQAEEFEVRGLVLPRGGVAQ